jgi:2-dehydro-3-deoxyphosphogluconate aldolase/(4S)-4-hydroxy-2-oxoglutarate aldolase
MKKILDGIAKYKIVVIMRKVQDDKILPVTQALYDGGIRLIEITYDQSDPNHLNSTGSAIKAIADNFKDMCVGAGTVLTPAQVESARDHGATFIVSPNTDAEVIKHTVELGLVSIPGALTPTEVVAAHKFGAHYVKLFPGGDFGPGYLKAVTAPINHIPIVVVGGVNASNMSEFMKAGAAGFGIGSNIVDKKLIDSSDYAGLTELAKTYTCQV